MDEHEIPPYFICPISLQIMRDPVTVVTGVSYDRTSIDRWLSAGRATCPVTNQPLDDRSLTPNSTLLRLILSWAATAAGKSCIPAPRKPAFNLSDIVRSLVESTTNPVLQMRSLKMIKTLIQEDVGITACMEKAGVASLVASMIVSQELREGTSSYFADDCDVIGESVMVLHLIGPSAETLKLVSERKNGELITILSSILQRGSYQARIHAALLLRSILKVVDDQYKRDLPVDLFDGAVEILKDQNSDSKTTMAVLWILVEVVVHRKNRVKAVEAGVVAVIVELLVEEKEGRRRCEAMLWVMELVCGAAEGRSALIGHPMGVAAVVGKVLKVSSGATERAVRVLMLLCRFCMVAEEMMEVGGAAKMCMVVQVEVSRRVRDMAKEILGMHIKVWRKSPCFSYYYMP